MKDMRIVIPARDEEASIGEVIEHTQKKACKDAEIIVVDKIRLRKKSFTNNLS